MENFKLVYPEHLNHYGYLFGGTLLKWVDEISYIAASLDYPGCNFVTIGLDKVEFRKSVKEGSILNFKTNKKMEGRTSVQYTVDVYKQNIKTGTEGLIFSTNITFVCIDKDGKKKPISK
jgi:acyl-CoA hydrolase